MTDFPRLIEFAFPLKQASLDSVHEKNVRHGHISTLHIWPARRPLAACRAALIATLLPDPGDPEKRRELCEKIGGQVKKVIERKNMPNGSIVEREKEVTEGGILHWYGEPKTKDEREIVQKQKDDIEWFRQEIRKAYGGRAPRVLDPFAGGGAIPLEAMRLGCEATAIDINPVAWFILKCTLEYPQKLAGQARPLPDFILSKEEFMLAFFEKAKGQTKGEAKSTYRKLQARLGQREPERRSREAEQGHLFSAHDVDIAADLAWHVRAWGQWVLDHARRDLAKYYPVYAEFQPLKPGNAYEPQPMQLVPLKDDGMPDIESLNAEFSAAYLGHKLNPRWVAKPTAAYLWARTVTCKNCRATLPLLKTRWLARKGGKRVTLTMTPKPDSYGVEFGIDAEVSVKGGNAAQRREHDKQVGAGTMSGAGAKCPGCGVIMTMEDIRVEGRAGGLGATITTVVVDGPNAKEYRLPTKHEQNTAGSCDTEVEATFADLPFGRVGEPISTGSIRKGGVSITRWGITRWDEVFTSRQLLSLGVFVRAVRRAGSPMRRYGYDDGWLEAVESMLAVAIDRAANYLSTVCIWEPVASEIKQTFLRFALPITWDFAEGNPLSQADRFFNGAVSNVFRVLSNLLPALRGVALPKVRTASALASHTAIFDLIVTDPPYYDAIPYADLMDFFYIWLRRSLSGLSPQIDSAFSAPLTPKWDHTTQDGELIDDESRYGNDSAKSKRAYEDGMARAFARCATALSPDGRLVIVFANKQPDAWETLVSAVIRAGFVVDGSWPIVTEMRGGVRNFNRASLASSVWLVCKKRPATAQPGWDTKVLADMRGNIGVRLREFWDAGIRGPDFVWAATGPALEAYSKHPAVKKTTDPGKLMTVSEFLTHVRRIVVDYVVGQVLSRGHGGDADAAAAERLDEPTAYYLLHRYDFGIEDAPVGAVILYAVSCGLSDHDLTNTWDLIVKSGGDSSQEEDADIVEAEEEPEETADKGSGSRARLKGWLQRKAKSLGYEAPSGRAIPLIDRIHRLMHLWRAGDVHKVDQYLDDHGLRRQELFKRVIQSLIELARHDKRPDREELQILESLANHIGAKGATPEQKQMPLGLEAPATQPEEEQSR